MKKGQKFIMNAAILTASSLLMRMADVSFTVYITNKIGAEGMGIYRLISSAYIIATTLAISGIYLTTTRLVAEELALNSHSGVKAAMTRCLLYASFFGMLALIIMFVAAPYISRNWLHGHITVLPIYALAVSLPFYSVSSVIYGYFTAVRRIAKSVSAQILEMLIKIIAGAYLLGLFLPRGIDYACFALILGGLAAEIVACIYAYIIYVHDKSRYKNNGKADAKLTKRMLGIALPVAFSSYIRSGLSSYKQIMIPAGLEKSGLSCAVSLAQYGIIGGVVMPILTFPSAFLAAFGSLVIPAMAEYCGKKDFERINGAVSRIFKVTLLFSICSAGVLFSYSDEITAMLYNNSEAAFLLKTFAPLVVIMYSDDIIDAILKGVGEQVYVVRVNIVDSVVSIALLYVLLPIYGIKGYITVLYISEIFNGFLSIMRLIKVTSFRFRFVEWCVVPTVSVSAAIIFSKLIPATNVILSITTAVAAYLILLMGTTMRKIEARG